MRRQTAIKTTRLIKVSSCDDDVFRQRHLKRGTRISLYAEEWSCEGEAQVLVIGQFDGGHLKSFGISKLEYLVSDYGTINTLRSLIGQ
jgi:hypothetical protein